MAGLQTKLFTQPVVEKHLGDFVVDPESASHTQINQLSGGMKVKVVLAAAMWQSPKITRHLKNHRVLPRVCVTYACDRCCSSCGGALLTKAGCD